MKAQGYKMFAIQKTIRDKIDRSSTISFDTNELATNVFTTIRQANGMSGTLIFSPEESTDIEEVKSNDVKKKSLSERLRLAMMNWYSRKEGNLIGFEDFRKGWIEKKINQFNGGSE